MENSSIKRGCVLVPDVNKKQDSLLTRSFMAYAIISIIILHFVKFGRLDEQYTRYLSWKVGMSQHQNYKEGVLYYECLTKLNPKDAWAFSQLGICYYQLKETSSAVEAYSQAIKLDPRYKLD